MNDNDDGGLESLSLKLSELMGGGFESGLMHDSGCLDRRGTRVRLQCHAGGDGDLLISGLLVLESRRPEPAPLLLPMFSLRKKAGGGGWKVKRDERLTPYWLWRELGRLARMDGSRGPSGGGAARGAEAEAESIMAGDYDQKGKG